MTRTSLIYVANAVLGIAAGIATLAGVQAGRTGGNDIQLACPANNPDCVQPGHEEILLACPADNPDCFQPGQVGAPCPIDDLDCVQPGGAEILLACPADHPNCDEVQSTEQVEVACNSSTGIGCDYQFDENILIAVATAPDEVGVNRGNG